MSSYPIRLTWHEASQLWRRGTPAAAFRDPKHLGDLEPYGDPDPGDADYLGDQLLAAPEFDHGSLLWCASYLESLLVAKVHEAAGYTTHLLTYVGDADLDG